MIVYLSGTITPKPEHNQWRGVFHNQLGTISGFTVLDPMRGKSVNDLDVKGYTSAIPFTLFVERDRADIAAADVMIVVFRKGLSRQSIGTWWECGWASDAHTPILLLTDDIDVFKHPFMEKYAALRVWFGVTGDEVREAYNEIIGAVRFLDKPHR